MVETKRDIRARGLDVATNFSVSREETSDDLDLRPSHGNLAFAESLRFPAEIRVASGHS